MFIEVASDVFQRHWIVCMARCRRTDLPHPKLMLLILMLLQKDLLNGVLSEKNQTVTQKYSKELSMMS